MEALKAENSKLKKDLISAMDEANIVNERSRFWGTTLELRGS